MPKDLPGWSPQLEKSFKEVLYRFLEEIHSTKAALYLLAQDGAYVLATHYGFGRRDELATRHERSGPVVARALETRTRPFSVNHPDEFPEFADPLMNAGTARLLVAPIYGESVLAGFVDARDKGGRRQFEPADEEMAARIAGDLLRLVRQSGLVAGLSPVETGARPDGDMVVRLSGDGAAAGGRSDASDAMGIDRAAMNAILRSARETMVRSFDVERVAVSVVEDGAAAMVLYCGDQDSDRDPGPMIRHQTEALGQHGGTAPPVDAWTVAVRDVSGPRATPRGSVIASFAPVVGIDWSLVVSVVVDSSGHRVSEHAGWLEHEIARHRAACRSRRSRRLLVRRLLLPGLERMPELAQHSEAVSRLAWATARELGLGSQECELALLAGYLHDVGMRELPDAAMYRHPSPGPAEKSEFHKHAETGGRILAGAGLEPVPTIVRHHHERFDGGGTPDGLTGTEIPLLSRIVHVAEVYDVLTSVTSYKLPVTRHAALGELRSDAGRQFDPEVVEALARVVEA